MIRRGQMASQREQMAVRREQMTWKWGQTVDKQEQIANRWEGKTTRKDWMADGWEDMAARQERTADQGSRMRWQWMRTRGAMGLGAARKRPAAQMQDAKEPGTGKPDGEGQNAGRRGCRELLAEQKGSSLLLILCIMMVAAALSLSILLAVGSLLATARRVSSGEQCRIMADSIGRSLDTELADRPYREIPSGSIQGDGLWEYAGAYVCSRDSSWKDYDPEGGPEHALSAVKRSFQVEDGSWPKEAGAVQIDLYWEKGWKEAWDGEEEWEAYFYRMDIDLHVEITCSLGDSACTIRRIYQKVNSGGTYLWKWSRIVERE